MRMGLENGKSPLPVTTIVTKRSSLLLIPEGSKERQSAPAVAVRKTATKRERESENTERDSRREREEREGRRTHRWWPCQAWVI